MPSDDLFLGRSSPKVRGRTVPVRDYRAGKRKAVPHDGDGGTDVAGEERRYVFLFA
jgi:hypothetical protein